MNAIDFIQRSHYSFDIIHLLFKSYSWHWNVCVYIYIYSLFRLPSVSWCSVFEQLFTVWSQFTIEFNCNSGGHSGVLFTILFHLFFFFFEQIRKFAVCDATFIHVFLFSTYAALILHILVPPGVLGHLSLLIKGGRFNTLGAILNKWCPIIIISMSEIYLSTSQFDNFITSKANTFVKMHVLFHRAVCPPLVKAIKLLWFVVAVIIM